jgi:hypothetical protein
MYKTHVGTSSRLLVTLLLCALVAPQFSDPVFAQGRGRGQGAGGQGRGRGQAAAPPPARGLAQAPAARPNVQGKRMPRGYQEPAFARGYGDGHVRGLADGKGGQRYDPADSRDYRDGDQGYSNAYGSRDAYRNNYRAGYRQGYEEGYREATR